MTFLEENQLETSEELNLSVTQKLSQKLIPSQEMHPLPTQQ